MVGATLWGSTICALVQWPGTWHRWPSSGEGCAFAGSTPQSLLPSLAACGPSTDRTNPTAKRRETKLNILSFQMNHLNINCKETSECGQYHCGMSIDLYWTSWLGIRRYFMLQALDLYLFYNQCLKLE